jgi:hypothetical protein
MTDDFTKARLAREARKKFGDPQKMRLIVDQGVADLWNRCAACWESDDDVKDLAIFSRMLDYLITHAKDHLIRDEEIIDELDYAKSEIASPRYLEQVPRSLDEIGRGQVLMHNHVRHTANFPSGVNGFRFWTEAKPPEGFHPCRCGWSGLPHYSQMLADYRCESWQALGLDEEETLREASNRLS